MLGEGGGNEQGVRIEILAPWRHCYDLAVQLIIQSVPNLSTSEPK
jgi:hypothetical protein